MEFKIGDRVKLVKRGSISTRALKPGDTGTIVQIGKAPTFYGSPGMPGMIETTEEFMASYKDLWQIRVDWGNKGTWMMLWPDDMIEKI